TSRTRAQRVSEFVPRRHPPDAGADFDGQRYRGDRLVPAPETCCAGTQRHGGVVPHSLSDRSGTVEPGRHSEPPEGGGATGIVNRQHAAARADRTSRSPPFERYGQRRSEEPEAAL